MVNFQRDKTILYIIILFTVSAFAMSRQLLTPGYFSIIENDAFTYTNWAWQFNESLKEGNIYPRWLPLNFWGYGGPIFILYSPLAFYLTSFFHLFIGSIISAMNCAKFAALFLCGVGMFFFAREYLTDNVALLTASFYLLCPYTIFQYYIAGTFASNISLMWFAPILLGIHRYIHANQVEYALLAGIFLAGLVLTHLINAYMFSFVIIFYVIYFAVQRKRVKALSAIPITFVTGFLLSSAYTLPLIFEKKFLQLKSFIDEGGGFHYGIFFILPDFSDKVPPDNFWHAYHHTFAFYLCLFVVLLIMFILSLSKLQDDIGKKTRAISIFFIVASVSSLFFLFGISTLFWETIPFFKYIQFPVRWLNITNFTVSFLASCLFLLIARHTRLQAFAIVFLILISFIFLNHDYKYMKYAHIFSDRELCPVAIVNSNVEHLPIWAVKEKISADDSKNEISIIRGEGEATIIEKKSSKMLYKINGAENLTARVRTFYFPGWKAYLNGTETAVKIEEESGAMLLDIPQGNHILELKFVDTPVRFFGKLISLFTASALIIFLIISKRRSRNLSHEQ